MSACSIDGGPCAHEVPQLHSCKALRRGEGGGDGRTRGLLGRSASGGLREPSGQGPAGPRGLRNALPTPSGGSTFPPETRMPLAGWARLRCQVHRPFLGEMRSVGPAGGGPRPPLPLPSLGLHRPHLGFFRPLLSTGLAIYHSLPRATQDSSHSRAIDQVTPRPPPPPWAALLPASACPSPPVGAWSPAGSSQEALPAARACRLRGRRALGPAREIRSSQPPAVFIRN